MSLKYFKWYLRSRGTALDTVATHS
jgi:hypothetical protein